MTTNPTADQREVADNVEDFVPDEFVLKTQRLFDQDCVAAHHHRIFQTTALDQIFLHQRLDLFVVDKRPGRRDLALEEFRYDVGRHELRETIVRPGLGARNPHAVVVRQQDEHCACFRFDVHRFANMKEFPRRFLCRNACAFDTSTYAFALPSPIGGSFASISTIALSTPIADRAASTCSTVCTRIDPSPIVVARSTILRLSILASIVGSSGKSLRLNLIPWSAGAGCSFSETFSPVCSDVPLKPADFDSVC